MPAACSALARPRSQRLSDRDVDGAFKGGATLSSLVRNGIADIATSWAFRCRRRIRRRTSEIGTVPSMVKTPFAQFNSTLNSVRTSASTPKWTSTRRRPGPATEVRNEIRTNFNATEPPDSEAGTNGVVRAQGEVRGTGRQGGKRRRQRRARRQAGQGRRGRSRTAPTTVAKSFRDTARKVVKEVRQAAKDAREAAKDEPPTTSNASAAGCADTAPARAAARPTRSAAAARTP